MIITKAIKTLTPKELQVFKLLVLTPHPRIDIAPMVKLSPKTLNIYVDRIYKKLNKHSRVELILWVVFFKLIETDDIRM